jgi:hypothetical protein
MIDPAQPFSSRTRSGNAASATKAELAGLLERARDERFRLLKMLQETRAQVAAAGEAGSVTPAVEVQAAPAAPPAPVPAPAAVTELSADNLRQLAERFALLDQKLDEKLARVNRRAEARLQQVQRLGQDLNTVDAGLRQTLAEAGETDGRLAQAQRSTRQLSARVAEQLQRVDQHLDQTCDRRVEAVEQQLEELRERLLRQTTDELELQRKQHEETLAAATAEAERQLRARLDETVRQLQQRAEVIGQQTLTAGRSSLAAVRKELVEAMARTHETESAFRGQIEQHRELHREHLDRLTTEADAQLATQAQRLDERVIGLTDDFEQRTQRVLADLQGTAAQLLDQIERSRSGSAGPDAATDQDQRHAA